MAINAGSETILHHRSDSNSSTMVVTNATAPSDAFTSERTYRLASKNNGSSLAGIALGIPREERRGQRSR
jgi:hypothetical protein